MTIPTEIVSVILGLIGTLVISLQAWTLLSVVSMREHLVRLDEQYDRLPCSDDCREQFKGFPQLPPAPEKKKHGKAARSFLRSLLVISVISFFGTLLISAFRNL